VVRTFVVGGVLACVAASTLAGPVAASAAGSPSTTDTWTIAGCTIAVSNSFIAAKGHTGAHWHTDGAVACTGTAVDAEARIDLIRNRVPVANSFARATCSLTSLAPCAALHASHDTPYHPPRADWQPRLVLFVRGPASLAAWATSDHCVLDIPSFDSICTFVGRATRR
jgi:hypothetical protein